MNLSEETQIFQKAKSGHLGSLDNLSEYMKDLRSIVNKKLQMYIELDTLMQETAKEMNI